MKAFLQKNLINKIPLSHAMGIQVVQASETEVILSAPLDGNTNHQGTGFGGSIYSVAVLSGWGLLTAWLKHENIDAYVVIKTATIDYRRPVTGDFKARCCFTSEGDLVRMRKTMLSKGRGRIHLEAKVELAGEVCASLSGEYVVVRLTD